MVRKTEDGSGKTGDGSVRQGVRQGTVLCKTGDGSVSLYLKRSFDYAQDDTSVNFAFYIQTQGDDLGLPLYSGK